MEINNPFVGICTKKESGDNTSINKSLVKWELGGAYSINNTTALSKIYNMYIDAALSANSDCLILVHDDVILEEDPIPKLEKLFDDYDLVGVAGASKIELKSPALWHLMGEGFQGGNLHGKVNHMDALYGPQPTYFGPCPHRVVMIDGVFMALNRKAMETVRFDEDCPSKFHMYDILLSLDACFKKIKIGVGDILITHESPGLREFTEDWKMGEKYLFEKYSEYYGNILTV